MFSRRLAPRLSSLASSTTTLEASSLRASTLRTFTATAQSQQADKKAPALADVAPDNVHLFDARQKEFRQQLAQQKQQREQQESQFASSTQAKHSSSSTSAASASSTGSFTANTVGQTSTASEQNDSEADAKKSKNASGRLSNLIYGTEEGREMDRQIERSFSQVLARGKYVHSIVFHEVKPDKVDEYVELVGSWYPRMAGMPENKVHLVGSWRTEVGDCDTFVHIWEYQRYSGYHASLHSIQHHPDFAAFDKKLKSLIHSKRTSLMQEFSFWPTSPPRQLGGVFELRSYTLHPGNLLEWEHHWRKGLEARKEVMEGVGAWFVQIGALNVVHNLWQFPDLEERKARREQSWSIPGWAETVHKTVPLIQTMESRILVPMEWSPVA